MDSIANLGLGFSHALTPVNLLYCFIGVTLGTLVGVLPGIGAIAAVSLLLPVTYYIEPGTALVMLAGIYYGAEYGGSIASILLNLPGTTSSAITCLDGYPLSCQGRAGIALFITAVASFFGATIGIIAIAGLAPGLAKVALSFGPPDYFAVMVLGLVAAATISRGSPAKGLAMVVLGILFGCVGTDVNSGLLRFTLGYLDLFDGISLVAVGMGLFGVSEVIMSIKSSHHSAINTRIGLRSMIPTREDMRQALMPMLRGSGVGGILGALPGTGPTIASFMAYALEKRVTKHPERFGNGAIEGISAPELANNSAAQTAFIPTLTLGIPGSATMALMLGALMIHGIQPGPGLMINHPDIFWGLIASFWIGNVLLLVLNIPLIGIRVRLLNIPYKYLYPAIICFICLGVYSINTSIFDIAMVLFFGVLGYGLRVLGFEPAPLLMGFILGPLIEEHMRRTLLISRGDFLAFFQTSVSATVLTVTGALLAWSMFSALRRRLRRRYD